MSLACTESDRRSTDPRPYDHREVLADFTSEEIPPDQFVDEWKVMKEVDKAQADELSELSDVLGSWGGASGGADVDMS